MGQLTVLTSQLGPSSNSTTDLLNVQWTIITQCQQCYSATNCGPAKTGKEVKELNEIGRQILQKN